MTYEFIFIILLLLPFIFVSRVPKTLFDFFKTSNPLSSWSISLSAVATNHSAFVYLGQIGFTYTYGLESLWLTVGWKLGDWFSMFTLQNKLKKIIERDKVYSLSELIRTQKLDPYSFNQLLFGALTAIALMVYASAQLTALSKVMQFYHVEYHAFLLLSVVIIVAVYLDRGGFEASIRTDVIQAIFIFISISSLFYFGVIELGGIHPFVTSVMDSEPHKPLILDTMEIGYVPAVLLFIFGWFIGGAGTIAQPHMLMRFMAANNQQTLLHAQIKYILISTTLSLPILGVAFVARELIPFNELVDPELALLTLSEAYFPHFLILLLAFGIISAAISTLDTLVIAVSTIFCKDINQNNFKPILPSAVTFFTMGCIYTYWLIQSDSVFKTIISSWALVSALYFPVILLKITKVPVNNMALLLGTIGSLLTLYFWKQYELHLISYELLPAILVFFMCYTLTNIVYTAQIKKKPEALINDPD